EETSTTIAKSGNKLKASVPEDIYCSKDATRMAGDVLKGSGCKMTIEQDKDFPGGPSVGLGLPVVAPHVSVAAPPPAPTGGPATLLPPPAAAAGPGSSISESSSSKLVARKKHTHRHNFLAKHPLRYETQPGKMKKGMKEQLVEDFDHRGGTEAAGTGQKPSGAAAKASTFLAKNSRMMMSLLFPATTPPAGPMRNGNYSTTGLLNAAGSTTSERTIYQ
ncbi:unnamed protein product, partial [Amoebophrya sp. A120]